MADARMFAKPRLYWIIGPLFVLLAYSNIGAGAFVYDDIPSLVEGHPGLSGATGKSADTLSGRPVLAVSFAVNHAVGGLDPWGYHLVNLLIHLGAGAFLFEILRRTFAGVETPARWRDQATVVAGGTTLAWLLHPLQTNAVTYIIQRAESLMAFFYLAALWAFLRAARSPRPRRWLVCSIVSCALGMGTKEVMVTAPLIILLYDRTFISGSLARAWRLRRIYYLGLAATWIILAALVISGGGNRGGTTAGFSTHSPWLAYWGTQFHAILVYLKLTLWPSPLILNYTMQWTDGAARPFYIILVIGIVAVAAYLLVARPRWGFFAVWWLAVLAPSSLVPGTIEGISEHRLYLALAPLLTLLVCALDRWSGRFLPYILAPVIMVFGGLTWSRNGVYISPRSVYLDSLAKSPGNARVLALLADTSRQEGNLAEAESELRDSALIEPAGPVFNNLGQVKWERGDIPGAIDSFQKSLTLDPHDVAALTNLGNALVNSGDPAGLDYLRRAVLAQPRQIALRLNLINALLQRGEAAGAAKELESALDQFPESADLLAIRGSVLIGEGRFADAAETMRRAVQLEPRNAEWHNRLGLALARAGRLRDAFEEFSAASALDPANLSAVRNAALARQKLDLR